MLNSGYFVLVLVIEIFYNEYEDSNFSKGRLAL